MARGQGAWLSFWDLAAECSDHRPPFGQLEFRVTGTGDHVSVWPQVLSPRHLHPPPPHSAHLPPIYFALLGRVRLSALEPPRLPSGIHSVFGYSEWG